MVTAGSLRLIIVLKFGSLGSNSQFGGLLPVAFVIGRIMTGDPALWWWCSVRKVRERFGRHLLKALLDMRDLLAALFFCCSSSFSLILYQKTRSW
jgi:hypothetical protein